MQSERDSNPQPLNAAPYSPEPAMRISASSAWPTASPSARILMGEFARKVVARISPCYVRGSVGLSGDMPATTFSRRLTSIPRGSTKWEVCAFASLGDLVVDATDETMDKSLNFDDAITHYLDRISQLRHIHLGAGTRGGWLTTQVRFVAGTTVRSVAIDGRLLASAGYLGLAMAEIGGLAWL